MLKMRFVIIVLGMLLSSAAPAAVQVSIGIGLPNLSIGINLPAYPRLVVVPGYPVYYAPYLDANYFFYDGMYWVYQNDDWYASYWYNGPWWLIEPEAVPVFILRIPVRYYRQPPVYFRGWRLNSPPRWGEHWGHDWEQHRSGWNKWNRRAVPAPAPLPLYQKQYSRDHYPQQVEQQQELHKQNYRYQPRDPLVRQRYQDQATQRAPVQQKRQEAPADRGSVQQETQRSAPHRQDGSGSTAPRTQLPQRESQDVPASPPQGRSNAQDHRQQPQPAVGQHERERARPQSREEKQQDKDTQREQKRRQEQERGRDRNE
jgi:hypothetical protein